MKLIIMESPAKAKHIAHFAKELNISVIAKASVGHIRQLKDEGLDNIGIDSKFNCKWEISKDKNDVVKDLIKAAKLESVDEIILASDPDREGEAIAWHLYDVLHNLAKVNKPFKRMKLNAITKEEFNNKYHNLESIDLSLVNAAITRSVLDKMYGYKLSNLVQQNIGGKSAGRVQSAVLLILSQLEKEIANFTKEFSYQLQVKSNESTFRNVAYDDTKKLTDKKILDINIGKNLLSKLHLTSFKVKDVSSTKTNSNSNKPFKTSTLLQVASSLFNLSVKEVTTILQKLYEAGLITYIRTDSTRLEQEFENKLYSHIEKQYGLESVGKITESKVKETDQEGHPAITPTDLSKVPSSVNSNNELTNDMKSVYKLIYENTILSAFKPATLIKHKVLIENNENDLFLANFNEYIDYGYYELFNQEKPKSFVNNFVQGQNVEVYDRQLKELESKPKQRLNEATLIQKLEQLGIGRPSTFASSVAVNLNRDYVKNNQKHKMEVTSIGMNVNDFLQNYFSSIISTKYTKQLEDELDKIAKGEINHINFISKIYEELNGNISNVSQVINKNFKKCVKCKEGFLKPKIAKSGVEYFPCSNWQNKCSYVEWDNVVKTQCPDCSKIEVKELVSKKGDKYIKCFADECVFFKILK